MTRGEKIRPETWLHTGDTLKSRQGRVVVIDRIEYMPDLTRLFHLRPILTRYTAGRGVSASSQMYPTRKASVATMSTLEGQYRRIHTNERVVS